MAPYLQPVDPPCRRLDARPTWTWGQGVKMFQEALLDRLSEGGGKAGRGVVGTLECWILDIGRHPYKRLGLMRKSWQWDALVDTIQARLALQIESMCTTKNGIPIFTIFDNGPGLKAVKISITWKSDIAVTPRKQPITAPRLETTGTIASLSEREPAVTLQKRQYPLEQLIVHEVWFLPETREQIILSCPKLRILRRLEVQTSGARERYPRLRYLRLAPPALHDVGERLIRLARDHCPKLEWFHETCATTRTMIPVLPKSPNRSLSNKNPCRSCRTSSQDM
ncbi:hypothetical protein BG015_001154 [Linnemannia schmuckeri]|uniref:Uncharacterized protein n=1 Tax=Linnemannia schmuckeri TaxID=64567 RepID=A0A9P5S7A4_9FUNG|nr:hypothetical protein BG015_001154 [Linnemannia schmuckeri]